MYPKSSCEVGTCGKAIDDTVVAAATLDGTTPIEGVITCGRTIGNTLGGIDALAGNGVDFVSFAPGNQFEDEFFIPEGITALDGTDTPTWGGFG